MHDAFHPGPWPMGPEPNRHLEAAVDAARVHELAPTEPGLQLPSATRSSLVRRFEGPETLALRQTPECDALHPNARVQDLARRMNLPQ